MHSAGEDRKEQVLCASFDKLELSPTAIRRVLLLGYLKGFQVFDVEDASDFMELVSRCNGPVTFLRMLPAPANCEKYKTSHPILVVVGGDEDDRITLLQPPTTVRFYSMKSNEYVKVIDFKGSVCMVRCSPRVVAIGLEEQVYCLDTLTLEKKFIVVTDPVPRVGEQGTVRINTGYGPLAVGPRWLAYSPNRSVSPSSGTLLARYAVTEYKILSEPENAGLVCVKDIVSCEVISQFRAHTSPISALCFEPSGTLLVTASVHGNNINIFRIMPSHDWRTSYVHLYKLYRGVTTAIIQDICFNPSSQWIAIMSSKGTCHIYNLSSFGGDNGLYFTVNEQNSSPPPPCTLSSVCRIKCSDSGLLNSVSNAAASMVGKMRISSGAIAAIFHNSKSAGSLDVDSSDNLLEHILVYTPPGFVVQHKIHSSESENEVKGEAIQRWDFSRRLAGEYIFDWQEKLRNRETKMAKSERPHWSNAEFQTHSPLWQKSNVHFHVMEAPSSNEIEKASSHEVEMRHRGSMGNYLSSIEKKNEANIPCHSNPPSFTSTESSEVGGTEKSVDLGAFIKEDYYDKPVDTSGEEKPDEEEWIDAIFDFSKEG